MTMLPAGERGDGWRARVEVGGKAWTVVAAHATKRRMPRPGEMARMCSRGRPIAMVTDREHAWSVHDGRRHLLSMRLEANGAYRAGNWWSRHGVPFGEALVEAIRAHAVHGRKGPVETGMEGEEGDAGT